MLPTTWGGVINEAVNQIAGEEQTLECKAGVIVAGRSRHIIVLSHEVTPFTPFWLWQRL